MSLIVKKVEERAIKHSLEKNISKKISDSNLKLYKKKSDDKTVPDTDEESQKPIN